MSLSDSFAAVVVRPAACRQCGATLTLNGGDCLRCLLETGLEQEQAEEAGEEELEELLAAVDIRDTDWRLGNYQILEEIGRGGMGVIYRARQRHSKRIVALKRVLGYHGDSRETLERFRREAEAAASLDHPNILPIYEVGEADGLPFFTMKLATGGSLQGAAASRRASPREWVRLVAKVARAVAYAHREGILHRDLKPGNILLDWRGEPMVTDFGLAKWIDTTSDLTRTLAVFGTPGFVAPEQARGPAAALTPGADIYSLGAILFELLSGRPPFLGEHAIAVIHQASEKTAPKLRSIMRGADRDLETICAKCLEREPQTRYRSAADLAEDLERWLEGRAIVARPVSAPTRAWRWSKRNPLVAAAVVTCAAVGLVACAKQMQSWRLAREVAAHVAMERSIGVLPFLDLDTATISEAWTQELVTHLQTALNALGPARVEILNRHPTVQATPSDSRPRAVLSGTMRIVNGKLRVSTHLLDAMRGSSLHQRVIEVDVTPAARLSAEKLSSDVYPILSSGNPRSSSSQPSDPGLLDPEARTFIQSGIELGSRRSGSDIDRSIKCLEHAVLLQPQSAAAQGALSKSLTYKSAYQMSREPLARALAAARRAVEIDPLSSDARLALAAVLYFQGRITDAIQENLSSIELSPVSRRNANLLANIYRANGRPDKALAWYAAGAGHERNPDESNAGIADCFVYLLQYERAEAAYEHYLKVHPEQPDGWIGMCRVKLLQGEVAAARALYQQHWPAHRDFAYSAQMAGEVEFFGRDFEAADKIYAELYEKDSGGGGILRAGLSYASVLGRIRSEHDPVAGKALLDRAREAELKMLDEATEDPRSFYRLAAIEASSGNTDRATEHLQRAFSSGWIDFRSLELDPRFDLIRDLPAYHDILDKMKQRVDLLGHVAIVQTSPTKGTTN